MKPSTVSVTSSGPRAGTTRHGRCWQCATNLVDGALLRPDYKGGFSLIDEKGGRVPKLKVRGARTAVCPSVCLSVCLALALGDLRRRTQTHTDDLRKRVWDHTVALTDGGGAPAGAGGP